MHISEGVLNGPVLVAGAAVALAGTAVGLRRLELDRVAQAGMLAAAFFVASLIHVPVGPSNAHLILNGIVGLLLGWAAFPGIDRFGSRRGSRSADLRLPDLREWRWVSDGGF